MDTLPERQKAVLITLLSIDEPNYAEAADRLHWPVGSIGPTRQRALRNLQSLPAVVDMVA